MFSRHTRWSSPTPHLHPNQDSNWHTSHSLPRCRNPRSGSASSIPCDSVSRSQVSADRWTCFWLAFWERLFRLWESFVSQSSFLEPEQASPTSLCALCGDRGASSGARSRSAGSQEPTFANENWVMTGSNPLGRFRKHYCRSATTRGSGAALPNRARRGHCVALRGDRDN